MPAVKPEVVGTENVQCPCGHWAQLELFEPDKFREQRRKKLANESCKACRAEKAAKTVKPPQQPKKKPKPSRWVLPERLPDEATFFVRYDAAKEQWRGTLAVDGNTFEGTHTAVFKLLRLLDGKYRDFVRSKGNGEQASSVVG
jgi:hypothetical protein